jgi:hypothetical protein
MTPHFDFVFSWESLSRHKRKYRAFYYKDHCCFCPTPLIEVYLDRILRPWEPETLKTWNEDDKIGLVVLRIHETLLHELAHWCDCSERQALLAEDLADYD